MRPVAFPLPAGQGLLRFATVPFVAPDHASTRHAGGRNISSGKAAPSIRPGACIMQRLHGMMIGIIVRFSPTITRGALALQACDQLLQAQRRAAPANSTDVVPSDRRALPELCQSGGGTGSRPGNNRKQTGSAHGDSFNRRRSSG